MDTFFVSHGSPTLAFNDKIPARPFLKSWQKEVLREAPRAILVISGHWESDRPTVNVIHGVNDTIYDFHGFPDHMYQMKYPAPGAPDLANSVKELLEKAGFGEVEEDKTRGLDHGAWVPLMLMYPEANIPVCQLSLQTERDGTYHYNMGKAIAPLRDQGILIIGSGTATHNLRINDPGSYGGPTSEWALNFDTWLNESLLNGRYEHINHYEDKSPCAKMAHPSPDHFYPLNVALGAAGEKARAEQIHHSWAHNTISYASYRFTTAESVQV